MCLTRERLDKYFRVKETDEDVVIFSKGKGKHKSLIRGKRRGERRGEGRGEGRGKGRWERDGCCGYPLEDLGALWYLLI